MCLAWLIPNTATRSARRWCMRIRVARVAKKTSSRPSTTATSTSRRRPSATSMPMCSRIRIRTSPASISAASFGDPPGAGKPLRVLQSKIQALRLSEAPVKQNRPAATPEVSHIQQPTMSKTQEPTMSKTTRFTSATGAPVADNTNIMTAGRRGPALLQDIWLIEKIAHFDREVIPERRMHAKGWGAHGTFTVTHDITRYTKAKIIMSDRGIPKSFRHMHLFGSHTFAMINAANERVWVKFHFRSQQGIQNLTDAEAAALVAGDRESHGRDLLNAIEAGDFPRWTLFIQVMTEAPAKTHKHNPFDLTKVWPKADYPLIAGGGMELNRSPPNPFAEVEQAAFSPANIVPGIGF